MYCTELFSGKPKSYYTCAFIPSLITFLFIIIIIFNIFFFRHALAFVRPAWRSVHRRHRGTTHVVGYTDGRSKRNEKQTENSCQVFCIEQTLHWGSQRREKQKTACPVHPKSRDPQKFYNSIRNDSVRGVRPPFSSPKGIAYEACAVVINANAKLYVT